MIVNILLLPLLFSNFLTDDAALSLAVQTYGITAARISKVIYNSNVVSPFSPIPGVITQYCVGIQEFQPATIQTPFGTEPNPIMGNAFPTITWKACGVTWDAAFVDIWKTAK